MDVDPRCEYIVVRHAVHALGCDGDLMTAVGQGVRQIEHVAFLTAYVRREELG
jgi:hypothetical protein